MTRIPPDKKEEIEKGTPHIIIDLIQYEQHTSVTQSILKKPTGTINVISFDIGEGLKERISPFDTYAQVIEGSATIVINNFPILLHTGEGIVIPAHTTSLIQPNGRFKLLMTVIKSGYE